MTVNGVQRPELRSLAAAVTLEAFLLATYISQGALFHWFVHMFVGASVVLLVLALLARTGRRVAIGTAALLAVAGHGFAAFPDVLFALGVAHAGWMDLFALHESSHLTPGGTWTLWGVFSAASLLYVVARYGESVQESHDDRGDAGDSGRAGDDQAAV